MTTDSSRELVASIRAELDRLGFARPNLLDEPRPAGSSPPEQPPGILLVGHPGSGRSTLGEAVWEQADATAWRMVETTPDQLGALPPVDVVVWVHDARGPLPAGDLDVLEGLTETYPLVAVAGTHTDCQGVQESLTSIRNGLFGRPALTEVCLHPVCALLALQAQHEAETSLAVTLRSAAHVSDMVQRLGARMGAQAQAARRATELRRAATDCREAIHRLRSADLRVTRTRREQRERERTLMRYRADSGPMVLDHRQRAGELVRQAQQSLEADVRLIGRTYAEMVRTGHRKTLAHCEKALSEQVGSAWEDATAVVSSGLSTLLGELLAPLTGNGRDAPTVGWQPLTIGPGLAEMFARSGFAVPGEIAKLAGVVKKVVPMVVPGAGVVTDFIEPAIGVFPLVVDLGRHVAPNRERLRSRAETVCHAIPVKFGERANPLVDHVVEQSQRWVSLIVTWIGDELNHWGQATPRLDRLEDLARRAEELSGALVRHHENPARHHENGERT